MKAAAGLFAGRRCTDPITTLTEFTVEEELKVNRSGQGSFDLTAAHVADSSLSNLLGLQPRGYAVVTDGQVR